MATLSNGLVSFTFEADATTGLKLTSFARAGGATWTNAETNLWKAKVYDTTTAPTTTTANITPTAATLSTFETNDATGHELIATWTAVPVGTDALTVTLTMRVNTGEDWLSYTLAAEWVGTPTKYALHDIGPVLLTDPLNQGVDFAALPFGFGIISEDPITNLRQANGVTGFPDTGFNLQATNRWSYPAGRGWSFGCWGYYSGSEGWMVYVEDHSQETFYCTFESDGTRLKWWVEQPQPDNVLVGNNSRDLGSGYTFCIRPMEITQQHGWWDIAKHYNERVEANPPPYYVANRKDRTDISDLEKNYSLFIEVQALDTTHALLDGKPGDLAGFFADALVGSGAPAGTPISGVVVGSSYNIHDQSETANGDLHAKMLALYNAGIAYMSMWLSADDSLYSRVWPLAKRSLTTVGDAADHRWWQTTDATGRFRISRTGYLAGGGTDRLAEIQTTGYYRERTYPITAWTAGTRTADVTGTPSADGFTGTLEAVLVPATGTARMARAVVQTMGASSIQITVAGWADYLGAAPVPVAGDSIVVFREAWDGGVSSVCVHAELNSSFYDSFRLNATIGALANAGICGQYLDVWTDPILSSAAAANTLCYRDHSTWSKINPGYTRHPYGAGDWYIPAKNQFVEGLKQAARSAQVAAGKTPFVWNSCEDIDETMHAGFDWCWHIVSSGRLWRATTLAGSPADPAIHKYKTVPMYAVAWPGRTMGRAVLNEFSTLILEPSAPLNDPTLHAFEAYCLASEWPYGLTIPTLDMAQTSTVPIRDFWDDTQYVAGGGTVSNTVKQIRDLYTQIITAESTWLCDAGFRYGEMMPPAVVNIAASGTTTGLAQSTWTAPAPFYHTYDTIYERTAFPRVVHAVWKHTDGTILVVLANWTDTAAAWSGALPLEVCGLGAAGSAEARRIAVRKLDYTGAESGTAQFDSVTGTITLTSVAAFSIAVVELTAGGQSSMATIVKGTTFNSWATAGGMHAMVESATISGIERSALRPTEISVATLSTTPLASPSDREVWHVSPSNGIATYDTASGEWRPGLPQVVVFNLAASSADVSAGQSLMSSGAGSLTNFELTLASGANTAKVCAVALHAVSAGGSGLAVIAGPVKAKASGAVAFGEAVKLSSTAGSVQSAGTVGSGAGWEILGTALQADNGGFVWVSLRR